MLLTTRHPLPDYPKELMVGSKDLWIQVASQCGLQIESSFISVLNKAKKVVHKLTGKILD